MTISPAEALRLSKASTLLYKHSTEMVVHTHEGKDRAVSVLTAEQVANLIDEATAAKDEIIARLRKELNDSYKEGQAEARGAYEEGRANEAVYQRGEEPGTF